MKAEDQMHRDVYTVGADVRLADAFTLMKERHIRHLPVVDERVLIGVLSDRDIFLRASVDATGAMAIPPGSVGAAMTVDVMSCRPTAEVRDIARMMLEHKIDAMPVTDMHGVLLGLLTSSDLLELAWDREQVETRRRIPYEFRVTRHAFEHG